MTRQPETGTSPGADRLQQQLLGLNLDFLQALRSAPQAGHSSARAELRLPEAQALALANCDAAALTRMAGCGFSLFALHLHRVDEWQHLARQSALAVAGVAETAAAREPGRELDPLAVQVGDFMHCAVFFAWHLAQQDAQAARLLLGMSAETAAVLSGMELGQCRYIAQRYTKLLSPRWLHNRYFWPDLLRYGVSGEPAHGKFAQLLGTQLVAQDLEPSAIARLTLEPDA